MHVYVIRDGVFTLNDGKPSSNLVHYEAFAMRYLAEFESVTMIGRLFSKEDPTAKPVEGPGVKFLALPGYHGPIGFLVNLPRLIKTVWNTLDPKSAYVLRVPSTIPILYSLLLRVKGIPFAVEVVGDPEDAYSPKSLSGHPFARFFQLVFVKAMAWQCSQSVAAAYVTAKALQSKYPGRSVDTMFSFTSIDLTPDTYVKEGKRIVPNSKINLVITGNMQKNLKGHDTLLESVALLNEGGVPFALTVIGFGERMDYFKSMAIRLGVDNDVVFVGKVQAGKAIRDLLDKADLFVLPSRQEGLPRALLEAMARGLPAIATRVGGTPELLGDEALIDPDQPKELAERIKMFFMNPDFMHQQAERNLSVSKRYSVDVVKAARARFYQKLIALSGK